MKGQVRIALGLIGALALSACVPTSATVSYGYNDDLYWNHYYYGSGGDIDIDVDRPDRPDPPVRPVPPIATLPDRPRPPIAKPPGVRPPIHRPARPGRPGGGGRLR